MLPQCSANELVTHTCQCENNLPYSNEKADYWTTGNFNSLIVFSQL